MDTTTGAPPSAAPPPGRFAPRGLLCPSPAPGGSGGREPPREARNSFAGFSIAGFRGLEGGGECVGGGAALHGVARGLTGLLRGPGCTVTIDADRGPQGVRRAVWRG